MALAGWLIGGGPSSGERTLALIAFAIFAQLLITSLNDVYDAPKDAVTAPHLPIPSGAISRRQGLALPVACGVALLALLVFLADRPVTVAFVLLTMVLGAGIGALYGVTKSKSYSALLASTGSAGTAIWGWLLSPRASVGLLVVLLAVAVTHGIVMNLVNQVRDAVRDPDAGNFTLAVRLGSSRTLLISAGFRFTEAVLIALLGVAVAAPWRAVILAAPLAALAVGVARAVSRRQESLGSREANDDILGPFWFSTFLAEVSLLFVISPPFGVASFVVMFTWFRVVRHYYRVRVISGRLTRGIVSDGDSGADSAIPDQPPSGPSEARPHRHLRGEYDL
ncbi:UbiA family prenyltransferase [Nonomuraea lactucae]|uniref:UbiA family prenyltransferase n=1 Tax=Nonomuraea lactucae TaxID=2249762 RepID=UPI0013B39CAF|nr:UbiA family prenyltransferase [Nonomuraea lactucae]